MEKKEASDKEDLMRALYSYRVRQADKEKEAKEKNHKFWDTQPVPSLDDKIPDDVNGPVEQKTIADLRKIPISLPDGFEWTECDMRNPDTVDEVYKLLTNNYVEDDDAMFRFDYSRDFLKWALLQPEYKIELHLGVRGIAKKKLVGFITGTPANISVYKKIVKMVEINFLCVHKKLRSKGLAPVLIQEVTRRVNMNDVWQAVYTAGEILPKPVARNRYYHRALDPKKLIEVGFSRLMERMTMSRTLKLFRLPETAPLKCRSFDVEKDSVTVHKMLTNYLKNFDLHQVFTLDEVKHCFQPRKDVIYCYVVEDQSQKITDFFSFYSLPSSVMGNKKHSHLKAAYGYYAVAHKHSWTQLMETALVISKQEGFDVFNALNVMDNNEFFQNLKFGIGDGHLQYYVYNWKCPEMKSERVGLVLL